MKLTIKLILLITIVAISTLDARRRRRDDKVTLSAKQKANDARVEKEIHESKDLLEPWDKVKTLARIDAYRTKLEKSAPHCAANMKQMKHNIENIYKIAEKRKYKVDLDAHGKQKAGTGLYNKGIEIQKQYATFFDQSVKCWKENLDKKRAAHAAAKPKRRRH